MIECFNRRTSKILATHHFDNRASLEQTLKRYVRLYNHHLPQKTLNHQPPIQAMKSWYASAQISLTNGHEITCDLTRNHQFVLISRSYSTSSSLLAISISSLPSL